MTFIDKPVCDLSITPFNFINKFISFTCNFVEIFCLRANLIEFFLPLRLSLLRVECGSLFLSFYLYIISTSIASTEKTVIAQFY